MIKCALQYILEIKSNQMLVLEERGKPEYPEKNLSEQSREPTKCTVVQRVNPSSFFIHMLVTMYVPRARETTGTLYMWSEASCPTVVGTVCQTLSL